ncbi:MAG: hypothetical protein WA190_02845 [Usitatibacter sp.]
MSGLDRKGGTMLTAREVASVAGGASGDPVCLAGPDVPAEGTDYPRNPAGPVIAESTETKFNRK